jgi:NAD(P)-dependent dehydrogenase (short-subunit alcohol dehydrogenase family)
MTLDGAVAVVTGGSRGVGAAIADALEGRGMKVARVARSSTQFTADVSRIEEVARLKQEVAAALGTPTVLVNAAGVAGPINSIQDSDPREWVDTIMINGVSAYLTCQAFARGMVEAGWGRVVNVSSASSFGTPGPTSSAYPISKVMMNQLTRHLAAELEGTGVTANVIHPGEVKTAMWADIREKSRRLTGRSEWADWVEETGGDPPEKAAKLVLEIIDGDANGRFLWIDDPLQAPKPSWD